MRVVLYLRYSSDAQTEQSIEGQERVCNDFCTRNGYEIVDTYIDRATSAYKNVHRRKNFIQMIKDSALDKFDAVVVYAVDRFARSKADHAIYQNKLKENGVQLLSATENLTGGNERIIVTSVLEAFSEYYSVELSTKVKRGMTESANKCQTTGGIRTFGYRTENKKYVLDETEAVWVKYIFEHYADGDSIKSITDQLNQVGVKTVRGYNWNKSSLHHLLHNKKYKGIYVYNDIEIPGGMPRIISDELYERVQLRSGEAQNKSGAYKATVDYKLSLKMYCKECGALMFGDSATGKQGKKYYYYTCSNHKKHLCETKSIKKDFIEDVVLTNVKKLLTPTMVDNIARSAEAFTKSPEFYAERVAMESRIAGLEKQNENLAMAIANAYSLTLAKLIQDNEKELERLRIQLAEYNATHITVSQEDIKNYINRFLNKSINNAVIDSFLIRMFVKCIFYSKDHIEIVYYTTPPTKDDHPITPIDVDKVEYINISSDVSLDAPSSTHTNSFVRCAYFNFGNTIFLITKVRAN